MKFVLIFFVIIIFIFLFFINCHFQPFTVEESDNAKSSNFFSVSSVDQTSSISSSISSSSVCSSSVSSNIISSQISSSSASYSVSSSKSSSSSYSVSSSSSSENYQRITVTQSSLIVSWDPPETNTLPNSYKFYYSVHNANNWIYLAQISSTSVLEISIMKSQLNSSYNTFDFGVSAVYSGNESVIHSSLENTAVPSSGWYIYWQ